VEKQLGKPDGYVPELRVAVYSVNTVIRRRLTLFLFILPVGGFRDYDLYDNACIEFDEHDNARCCEIILRSSHHSDSEARHWLKNRDKEKSN
jgi:hypothetical protein